MAIGVSLVQQEDLLVLHWRIPGKAISDGAQWLFGDKKTPEQRKMELALAQLNGGIIYFWFCQATSLKREVVPLLVQALDRRGANWQGFGASRKSITKKNLKLPQDLKEISQTPRSNTIGKLSTQV